MTFKSPILVVHETDGSRRAKRFVAALCFFEFYTLFVCYGTSIWRMNGDYFSGPTNASTYDDWTRIALFAGTAFLYLCGRSLWRGGRRQTLWLWVGILGLFAIIVLDAVATAIVTMNTALWSKGIFNASPTLTPGAVMSGLQAACLHIPLWAALIVLWLATRTSSRWRRNDKALWVYCAAAYCLGGIVAAAMNQNLVVYDFAPAMLKASTIRGIQYAPMATVVTLMFATAILLFRGSRFARSTALTMATMNAVAVGASWFVISWLVNIATKALLYQVPFTMPVKQPFTWTKHDFIWLVVLPVHYVLPWLLIAGYAWRVPMRKPPDDGNPFPRRYCANCLYILFGSKSDHCPECGCALNATE